MYIIVLEEANKWGTERRVDIVTSVPNSDWLEVVPNVGIHFGIKMSVLSCLLVVVSTKVLVTMGTPLSKHGGY